MAGKSPKKRAKMMMDRNMTMMRGGGMVKGKKKSMKKRAKKKAKKK
mgnify:CR=1 FL=1|jgi:hypothetical protein